MARDEHYVYLNNLGDLDIYPLNCPSKFENRITPSIQLNAETEYEIGLINCLLPKSHLAIVYNDQDAAIDLWAEAVTDDVPSKTDEMSEIDGGGRGIDGILIHTGYFIHSYIPQTNFEAGDIEHMVETINREMVAAFRKNHKPPFTKYIKGKKNIII